MIRLKKDVPEKLGILESALNTRIGSDSSLPKIAPLNQILIIQA